MARSRTQTPTPTATPAPPADRPPGQQQLAAKLEWLMLFRVLMVTVLLGAPILSSTDTVSALYDPFRLFLYGIIIATYAMTLVYAPALRRVRNVEAFAHVQLGGDVVVSAGLVHATGDADSVFTFLFSLSIINGAILLFRRGALSVATYCSVAFLVIVAHEAGWIHIPGPGSAGPVPDQLYYVTFIHLTTFYLVAILASYLAEQLRRAGRELDQKTHDIAELRALNDNIVGSLSSGLITVDRSGRMIAFNEGAARLTGHARDDVMGRPLADVFPELADVLAFSPDPRTERRRLETVFTRRDNARIIVEYAVSPLMNPQGRVFGTIVHFHDATQIHALESAVKRHERLAAVGELAAAIAHEIRNPLASISGSVEMLGALPAGGESHRRLREILLRETERLDDLITDFLKYARPAPPEPASTDLGHLVSETLDAFRQALRAEGRGEIRILHEAHGDAFATVDGDQVRQVLWNLLHNAAQAMEGVEGGAITVVVELEAAPGRDGPPSVWVRVRDQGPGVPPAIRDRIFEPFYTTRKDGTGLGLAICQRIVEDHDGDLVLASPEGGGAEFSFRLRARPQAAAEAVA